MKMSLRYIRGATTSLLSLNWFEACASPQSSTAAGSRSYTFNSGYRGASGHSARGSFPITPGKRVTGKNGRNPAAAGARRRPPVECAGNASVHLDPSEQTMSASSATHATRPCVVTISPTRTRSPTPPPSIAAARTCTRTRAPSESESGSPDPSPPSAAAAAHTRPRRG